MTIVPLQTYLQTHRKRTGLTHDEVAFLCGGMCGAGISKHENGKRVPTLRTALFYEFITGAPIQEFRREVANLVLAWKDGYSQEMICHLVAQIHGLGDSYQTDVWRLVKGWASTASDYDRAIVREKVRVTVLSRRGARRSKNRGAEKLSAAATEAYQALEPSDILNKYAWLFQEQWVEESADELQSDDLDFRKREERIANFRTSALREIVAARGLAGILALAETGNAAGEIGWLMARSVLSADEIRQLLVNALRIAPEGSAPRQALIRGVLQGVMDSQSALEGCRAELTPAEFVRLLALAPFRRSSWLLVDKLEAADRETYWSQERELVANYQGWGNALQYTHPFVATELLLRLAQTYEEEAKREDTEADIRVRLR